MGVWSWIKSVRNGTVWPGVSPADSNPTGWLGRLIAAMQTASGVAVSEDTALGVSDWYKCITVISETIAMLPLKPYSRLRGQGREEATDHPLYFLLHDEPNEHMTAFVWVQCILLHLLGWGRHASYIERDPVTAFPKALWPIAPNKCRWELRDGQRWFFVQTGAGEVKFWDDEILWIPGMTKDGYQTYSPVQLHREALGLAKAAETYGARFFGNGGRVTGVLKHPGVLSKEAKARLKEQFEEAHGSLDTAMRLMVLEEGLSFDPIGTPPDEAQFLETRKFMRGEVAGILRVPPHKIGDLERSTNNNIEHQDLEFLRDCLMPHIVRIEQGMKRSLLNPREKKRMYVKFDVKGMMRGDTIARMAFYKGLWGMGAMNANQVLASEDENPIDGGDRFYVQAGFIPTDKVDEVIANGGMKATEPPKQQNGGDK